MAASVPPTSPDGYRKLFRQKIDRGEFGKQMAEIVLAVPMGYLVDAKRSFDAKLNEGASLLCRASMEAAMYTFLYAEPVLKEDDPALMSLKPSDDKMVYQDLYNKIAGIRELDGTKFLSDPERDGLLRIGTHGNVIAHIIERFHRSFVESLATGSEPDFPYPESGDVEKDIAIGRGILHKFRDRLGVRIQSRAEKNRN